MLVTSVIFFNDLNDYCCYSNRLSNWEYIHFFDRWIDVFMAFCRWLAINILFSRQILMFDSIDLSFYSTNIHQELLVLFGVLSGFYSLPILHKIIDILVHKKKNLFFNILNNNHQAIISIISMLLGELFLPHELVGHYLLFIHVIIGVQLHFSLPFLNI